MTRNFAVVWTGGSVTASSSIVRARRTLPRYVKESQDGNERATSRAPDTGEV